MKVTFDKNVYEFIVDPQKPGNISDPYRACYSDLRNHIVQGNITPLVSEVVFTYEALRKEERKKVLSDPQIITSSTIGDLITISSNPELYPGNIFDDSMLPKAIELGFKILPGFRSGKLINPNIKAEWFYVPGDYLKLNENLSAINTLLDEHKVGNIVFYDLLGYKDETIKPLHACINDYTGSMKKFNEALSERCDGDTVSVHINYVIDIFCTNDCGKNAGHSVLNPGISTVLSNKFQFRKMNPLELLSFIQPA